MVSEACERHRCTNRRTPASTGWLLMADLDSEVFRYFCSEGCLARWLASRGERVPALVMAQREAAAGWFDAVVNP